ncbi:ATP-binding protein [Euzebya rosea]|uniref:ATP-binding protein n=1 Tax=Euzebya rosea TaxID=2052804 RepID=UPI0014742E4C|nr:ATP-binding protein [Euzebya rosea]
MDLDPLVIVGAAPVPWCLVDADGRILRANGAMEHLCDCPAEQLEGRPVGELVPEVDQRRLDEPGPGPEPWVVTGRLLVGGRRPHVTVTGAPVPTDDDQRVTILVLADVSDLVRATTEVDQLRRAALDLADQRIAMVATIAHELRSPLHAITGWTEMLAGTSLDPDQRDLLDSLDTAVHRLRQTVDEFLEISRLDAGEVPLRPTVLAIRELVDGIVARHRQRAAERGTDLLVHVDESVPATVHVDGYRLDQILTNLVANAVTHGAGGPVEISVDAVEATVRVVVRDHGKGVPEAYRDRVFEPFVRAPGAAAGGTGLGLPLVRSLAARLGGDIRLESPTNGGARFVLTLPLLSTTSATEVVDQPSRPGTEPTTSATVLVVEDNEMIQLLSAQQLRSLGHSPVVVGTGAEALHALVDRRLEVDLVLMDWQLPDLPGTEVCRRFREAERQQGRARTPVVALTANVMPDTRAACLAAGMDDFLPKPVSAAALGTTVGRWTADGAGPADVLPDVDVSRLFALGAGSAAVDEVIRTARGQLALLGDDLHLLGAAGTDPARLLHGHRIACEMLGLARLADTLRAIIDGGARDEGLHRRATADIDRATQRIDSLVQTTTRSTSGSIP